MQAAHRLPGAIRFGVGQAGSVSNQCAKLLSATPVPGTTTPDPKPFPSDCVMLATFPGSSTTERCVVIQSICPGFTTGTVDGARQRSPSLRDARSRLMRPARLDA